MKAKVLALAASAAIVLGGCAQIPQADAPMSKHSADYLVAGDPGTARAFVYGNRTVLEFKSQPYNLAVYDENGSSVSYEREGKYYLLSRKLAKFTAWYDMRAVRFAPVKRAPEVMPTAPQATPAPVATVNEPAMASLELGSVAPGDSEAQALLDLSKRQLEEVRMLVGRAKTEAETKALNDRLNRVEAQLIQAATAIVRVQFESEQTEFNPSPEVARVLVPAAKAAESINVRGRTDSKVPGSKDPRIALQRALAARKFLVDQGVSPEKIRVFSSASGDFTAPASDVEGRAINRRVEIELVSRRYAELTKRATNLAKGGA